MMLLQIGSNDIELISEDDEDDINVDPSLVPIEIAQESDTDKPESPDTHTSKQVTNFISIFLIKLQFTFRLSNNIITVILHFLTALLLSCLSPFLVSQI